MIQKSAIKTDVFAACGTELQAGDRIEVTLPPRSVYSGLLLARGAVFFQHGSFRVRKEEAHPSDCHRLYDFSPNCIITLVRAKD